MGVGFKSFLFVKTHKDNLFSILDYLNSDDKFNSLLLINGNTEIYDFQWIYLTFLKMELFF